MKVKLIIEVTPENDTCLVFIQCIVVVHFYNSCSYNYNNYKYSDYLCRLSLFEDVNSIH